MAIEACRECGSGVSGKAPTCPHCGVANPSRQRLSAVHRLEKLERLQKLQEMLDATERQIQPDQPRNAAKGGRLANLGKLLMVVGAIGFYFALTMKTSVQTGTYIGSMYVRTGEWHNAGLMTEKQNYVITAGFVTLIGAVLLGVGTGKAR